MAIDLEKLDQNFSNKSSPIFTYIDKNFNIYRNLGITNVAQFIALVYERLFSLFLGFLVIVLTPVGYFLVRYSSWINTNAWKDISWYEDLGLGILIFLLVCFSITLIFGLFATIISINSYLRKISQNTTITDEQQFKVIISCPSCKQKTRVPANKELEITCPSCNNEWVEKT
jgi:hypothetical protein